MGGLEGGSVGLGAAKTDFEAKFAGERGLGVDGEVGVLGGFRVGDLDVVGGVPRHHLVARDPVGDRVHDGPFGRRLLPAAFGFPARQAHDLGATEIVAREDINETTKRPLEAEKWGGCVDAVGGDMLARLLGQMKYGASVSAVGLAGGAGLPATVIPFLLRGVNLLGIDSVMQPYENRVAAWKRIASDLPMAKLEAMVQPATLSDLPQLGRDILKGNVKGRVVVDVNA